MQSCAAFTRTGLSLHAFNRFLSQAAHEDYTPVALITCVEEIFPAQRWLRLLREDLGSPAPRASDVTASFPLQPRYRLLQREISRTRSVTATRGECLASERLVSALRRLQRPGSAQYRRCMRLTGSGKRALKGKKPTGGGAIHGH